MKVDFKKIFPALTAFIAFILTLCCLFAGTQQNLLDGADLLTVRLLAHHKTLCCVVLILQFVL